MIYGSWKSALHAVALALGASVGSILAILYADAGGDRRSDLVDRNLAKSAALLRDLLLDEESVPPSSLVFHRIEKRVIPQSLFDSPGSYFVQYLPVPNLLPVDKSKRAENVAQICNQIPEWRPSRYIPRTGMAVDRSYLSFLSALEPINVDAIPDEERARFRTAINSLRRFLNLGEPEKIDPESAKDLADASGALKKVFVRYETMARKRGYATIGPIPYLWQYWNNASDTTVHSGDRSHTIKACTLVGLDLPIAIDNAFAPDFREGSEGVSLGPVEVLNSDEGNSGSVTDTILSLRRVRFLWFDRPGWFKPEALRLYGRSGPYQRNSLEDPETQLWGPNGAFNLLPVGAIVADSPSAILRLPNSDAARLLHWSTANQKRRLNIDGITFERNASGLVTDLQAVSHALTLVRPGGRYIVAIVSLKLPSTRLLSRVTVNAK